MIFSIFILTNQFYLYHSLPHIAIHPITFAMELKRITTIHIGARYFIKKQYIFLRLKRDDCSISFEILSSPTTRVTKMQVDNAANGIIRELVRKSNKSKIDIPSKETKSNTPKPSAEAEPNTTITTPISKVDLCRLNPN